MKFVEALVRLLVISISVGRRRKKYLLLQRQLPSLDWAFFPLGQFSKIWTWNHFRQRRMCLFYLRLRNCFWWQFSTPLDTSKICPKTAGMSSACQPRKSGMPFWFSVRCRASHSRALPGGLFVDFLCVLTAMDIFTEREKECPRSCIDWNWILTNRIWNVSCKIILYSKMN